MSDSEEAFGCFLMVLVMMIAAVTGGCYFTVCVMRANAVQARVAHWEVNGTTGQTTFVYDSPKKEPVPIETVTPSQPE